MNSSHSHSNHLVLTALRLAYTSAIHGLKLANRLKCKVANKKHRGRIMGNLNRIRAELLRVEKLAANTFKPTVVKSKPAVSMAYPILKRWGIV